MKWWSLDQVATVKPITLLAETDPTLWTNTKYAHFFPAPNIYDGPQRLAINSAISRHFRSKITAILLRLGPDAYPRFGFADGIGAVPNGGA